MLLFLSLNEEQTNIRMLSLLNLLDSSTLGALCPVFLQVNFCVKYNPVSTENLLNYFPLFQSIEKLSYGK